MRNEEAMMVLPELEEPFCCSKVQDLANGVEDIPVTTGLKISPEAEYPNH
jgi:hypothetical protein